jgi:hypothetical protein
VGRAESDRRKRAVAEELDVTALLGLRDGIAAIFCSADPAARALAAYMEHSAELQLRYRRVPARSAERPLNIFTYIFRGVTGARKGASSRRFS